MGIFKLEWADFGRGLLVAVLATVVAQLLLVLNAPGFSFETFQWAETFRIALVSGLGYLLKNLATDSQGNLFGIGSK